MGVIGFIFVIFIIVIVIICVRSKSDDTVCVQSVAAVRNYNYVKYFSDDSSRISRVEWALSQKKKDLYKVKVVYTSPSGRRTTSTVINISSATISYFHQIQNRAEQEKIQKERKRIEKEAEKQRQKREKEALKEEQKAALDSKQHEYYDKINKLTDNANSQREKLIINDRQKELDRLMGGLIDRAFQIKKVKSVDSGDWYIFDNLLSSTSHEIDNIIQENQKILDYYESNDFKKIKDACKSLMDSQKEFNDYLEQKAQSISSLFGSKVVRSETVNDDRYDYIRPYKKTITPFTAEVSNAVFASAENNPMDYIVKQFYPNKSSYKKQIQKLQL